MAKIQTVGRRRFLGVAAVVAGGVTGVGAYAVAKQEAIQQAHAAGMAAGRQAALNDMKQINGVSVDTATHVAHTTQQATTFIALPVARMVSQIAGDALSTLISAVDTAQNVLFFVGGVVDLLGHLKSLLTNWKANIVELPALLEDLSSADIDSGAIFLEGLLALLAE